MPEQTKTRVNHRDPSSIRRRRDERIPYFSGQSVTGAGSSCAFPHD
jgi:hypothetical protein